MKIYVAIFFGCSVIISGLIRYLGGPDGEKGLWFGVVFGTIALVASFCFSKARHGLGQVLLWISLLFVGGWFGYEAFIKKGFVEAELRLLIMFVLTVVTATLQWLPKKRTDPAH